MDTKMIELDMPKISDIQKIIILNAETKMQVPIHITSINERNWEIFVKLLNFDDWEHYMYIENSYSRIENIYSKYTVDINIVLSFKYIPNDEESIFCIKFQKSFVPIIDNIIDYSSEKYQELKKICQSLPMSDELWYTQIIALDMPEISDIKNIIILNWSREKEIIFKMVKVNKNTWEIFFTISNYYIWDHHVYFKTNDWDIGFYIWENIRNFCMKFEKSDTLTPQYLYIEELREQAEREQAERKMKTYLSHALSYYRNKKEMILTNQ